jgi:large repetitive protein
VAAASLHTAPNEAAYAAHADVTSLVRGLADPRGTYTVADVQTGRDENEFGGWALVVAYRQPAAPRRAIAVFDDVSPTPGVLSRVTRNSPIEYVLTGLPTPKATEGVQLGVLGYEGDLGLTGDTVTVGPTVAGDTENFFDSGIDVGGAERFPDNANQYGFDAHLLTVNDGFGPTDASLAVTVNGGSDILYVGGLTIAVPV